MPEQHIIKHDDGTGCLSVIVLVVLLLGIASILSAISSHLGEANATLFKIEARLRVLQERPYPTRHHE